MLRGVIQKELIHLLPNKHKTHQICNAERASWNTNVSNNFKIKHKQTRAIHDASNRGIKIED
jgi:hypothetical protein